MGPSPRDHSGAIYQHGSLESCSYVPNNDNSYGLCFFINQKRRKETNPWEASQNSLKKDAPFGCNIFESTGKKQKIANNYAHQWDPGKETNNRKFCEIEMIDKIRKM